MYRKEENNLSVDDLLKVSKYSIAFAEIMNSNDENIELASAAITVFQGIEAVLNNKPQDISINKKLHIANGFLSSIVKANINDSDTKRCTLPSWTRRNMDRCMDMKDRGLMTPAGRMAFEKIALQGFEWEKR